MNHPLVPKWDNAVWGFIVGDALGVPYEFSDRQEMQESPATDMVGFGTHLQPPGTWSDDTSMVLCVLENLLKGGTEHGLAKLFLDWYLNGHNTSAEVVFDIGITTRISLQKIAEGVPPSKAGSKDAMSAGNGSLMRCFPYAFLPDYHEGIFRMLQQSRFTHALSICHECCMFYCRMIRLLAEGYSKEEAKQKSVAYLRHGWRITDQDEDSVAQHLLFKKIFSENFSELPVSEIKSGGYVLDTLEAAVWCFLNTNNYEEAVLKAVNLGGDTDTIAALTGALAATHYGKCDIPEKWIEMIVNRERVEEICQINVVKGL